MYGYVYLTVNLVNGKKYIGQHKGKFTTNYLGSGKLIRRAIKKYGKENFIVSILEYADSKETLNKLEIDYISRLKKSGEENYNLAKGGNYIGSVYDYMTDEEIKERSQKISNTLKGRKLEYSDEEREKRRQKAIERNKSDFMKEVCIKRNKERVWNTNTLKEMSKRMSNNKINLGKKYIHRGTIRKMIPIDKVDEYLNNGWELGMGKYNS